MKKILMLAAMAVALVGAQAQTQLDYANAGDEACKAEKWQEAADNYIKSLALDTEKSDYTTAMQLGYCYEQMGQMQQAGDAYKDSYLRGNYDTGILSNMRKAYEAAQCAECLKTAYNEIAEAFPEQQVAMARRLYVLYSRDKDNANALRCCQIILTDPELDQANTLKYLKYSAQFAMNMDSTDLAESYYDQVLAITPDDADIHKVLGLKLNEQIKRIDEAAKATYSAKQRAGKATQHDYSTMLTATKRATLKYGPKAVEHLKIANQTLKDPQLTKIIGQLQNNITAYSNR